MTTYEQDEAIRWSLANAQRRLDEFDKDMRVRREQRAKAHGFPNWKEYNAVKMQEAQETSDRFQASIEEECKRLGITTQQYWAEHPQRSVVPDWPECNCDGHIIPFFCPQRLLPYQSMNGEDPSWLLRYTPPPQIEQLSMNEGDTSRRLPDDILERVWLMDSQKAPLELPQWTGRDPVVKRMATSASEHSSSPLSCSPGISFSIPSESITPPTRVNSEQNSFAQVNPGNQPHAAAQQLPERTAQSPRKVSTQTLRKGRKQNSSKKVETLRLSRSSGIKERTHPSKSRIQKRRCHSMCTRSRGATIFYAL